MTEKDIGERHTRILEALAELARSDPTGAANMQAAAERAGLDAVGKEPDREEFLAVVRDLEEAGYVETEGTGQAAAPGNIVVTEEGYKRAEQGR